MPASADKMESEVEAEIKTCVFKPKIKQFVLMAEYLAKIQADNKNISFAKVSL